MRAGRRAGCASCIQVAGAAAQRIACAWLEVLEGTHVLPGRRGITHNDASGAASSCWLRRSQQGTAAALCPGELVDRCESMVGAHVCIVWVLAGYVCGSTSPRGAMQHELRACMPAQVPMPRVGFCTVVSRRPLTLHLQPLPGLDWRTSRGPKRPECHIRLHVVTPQSAAPGAPEALCLIGCLAVLRCCGCTTCPECRVPLQHVRHRAARATIHIVVEACTGHQ